MNPLALIQRTLWPTGESSGQGNCFFWRHAALDTFSNMATVDAASRVPCPFRLNFGLAPSGYGNIATSILGLFSSGSPSAIIGRVWAVVISPVKRQASAAMCIFLKVIITSFFSPLPKGVKRCSPSWANRDSPRAVKPKISGLRIVALGNHEGPDSVKPGPGIFNTDQLSPPCDFRWKVGETNIGGLAFGVACNSAPIPVPNSTRKEK